MKKIITSIIVFFMGIIIVNAEYVDISRIDTNTYIIGYRVFELNNYDLSIYDVSQAIAEYASINDTDVDNLPIYFYSKNKNGSIKLEQIIGSINGKTKVPVKLIKNVSDVFKNNKIEITYLNNTLVSNNTLDSYKSLLNDLVNTMADVLNNNYGFGNININNNIINISVKDKTSVLLSASSIITDSMKKYVNMLDKNTIINYVITFSDNSTLNGNINNLKLNSLIKLLRDISKKMNSKNNSVKIDINISLNNEEITQKYDVIVATI